MYGNAAGNSDRHGGTAYAAYASLSHDHQQYAPQGSSNSRSAPRYMALDGSHQTYAQAVLPPGAATTTMEGYNGSRARTVGGERGSRTQLSSAPAPLTLPGGAVEDVSGGYATTYPAPVEERVHSRVNFRHIILFLSRMAQGTMAPTE